MPNLISFYLSFSFNKQVTDSGLKHVAIFLLKHQKLSYLGIDIKETLFTKDIPLLFMKQI